MSALTVALPFAALAEAPAQASPDSAAGKLVVEARALHEGYLALPPSAYQQRTIQLAKLRGVMDQLVSDYPWSPMAERWMDRQRVAGMDPVEIEEDWQALSRDREGCISSPSRECLMLEAQIAGCNIQHEISFPYSIFESQLHAIGEAWPGYNRLIRESVTRMAEDEFHDRKNPALFQIALSKALAGDWRGVEEYEVEVQMASPGMFPVLLALAHARGGNPDLREQVRKYASSAPADYLPEGRFWPIAKSLRLLEGGDYKGANDYAARIEDARLKQLVSTYALAMQGNVSEVDAMAGKGDAAGPILSVFRPLARLRAEGHGMKPAFEAAHEIEHDALKAIAFALLAGHFDDEPVSPEYLRELAEKEEAWRQHRREQRRLMERSEAPQQEETSVQ